MIPALESEGGYAGPGTTVSDVWPSAPAAGSRLFAITLSSAAATTRGTMPAGWTVAKNVAGVDVEVADTARVITVWTKVAGSSEPLVVTFTAGGGVHGMKMFAFPSGNVDLFRSASTGGSGAFGLALGTSAVASPGWAAAALLANGSADGVAITGGAAVETLGSRAFVADREVSAGNYAPTWTITGSPRGLSAVLVVVYEASAPVVSFGADRQAQAGQTSTIGLSVVTPGTEAGPYTTTITQTAGQAVTLTGTGSSRTVTWPTPSPDPETFTFEGYNTTASGVQSNVDTLNVVVSSGNAGPVVSIVAGDTVPTGTAPTVTGSAADPDGTLASLLWTVTAQPAGSAVTFADPTSLTPGVSTFDVDGPVTLRLTATDNQGKTSFAEVTITAGVAAGVWTAASLPLTIPETGVKVRLRIEVLDAAAGEVHQFDAIGLRHVTGVEAPEPATVPGPPTAVAVTTDTVLSTATIRWAPPADDGGSIVTGYVVAQGDWSTTLDAATSSHVLVGLNPATTYAPTVRAVNGLGSGPAVSVRFQMGGVPARITSHPQSAVVVDGAPVVLTVVAEGTAPITFQWHRDGADVPGATAPSHSTTTPGTYTVTARNVAGVDTSDPAAVTVATKLSLAYSTTVDTGPWAVETELAGAKPSAPIAVRLVGTTSKPIAQVSAWKVDGVTVRTGDLNTPYDLVVNAGLYTFTAGTRTVTATVVYGDGTTEDVAATFTVVSSGTYSSGVLWKPLSVDGWGRHTQAGHEQTDLRQITVAENGWPLFNHLTTRVLHHPGDKFPAGGGARSEWRVEPTVGQPEGLEYWQCFAFYLPAGYPNPNGWGQIIHQMHGGSGSPTYAFRIDPSGSLQLDLRGGAIDANYRTHQLLASVPRGAVQRVKFYCKASASSAGRFGVWINGVQRLSPEAGAGPNKYTSSTGYLKFGKYGGDTGVTTEYQAGDPFRSTNEADIDLHLGA